MNEILPKHLLWKIALVGVVWSALATFPLITMPQTALVGPVDAWLNIYTLNYVYQFVLGKGAVGVAFFDGLMFFPSRDGLGFTETLFGIAPIYWALRLFTKNPVLAYNALIGCCLTLSTVTTFIFARDILRFGAQSSTARLNFTALIAALLFSFSPLLLSHLGHLQLLTVFWMPLSLYLFFRFQRERRGYLCFLAALSAIFQLASCAYIGLFLLIALVVIAAYSQTLPAVLGLVKRMPKLTIGAAFCLVALALCTVIPYQLARMSHDLQRSTNENIGYGAKPIHYLTFPSSSVLAPKQLTFSPEKELTIGMAATSLALLGLPLLFRVGKEGKAIVVVTLVAVLFSMGPEPQLFGITMPSPYKLLVEKGVIFSAMRVTARWGILTSLGTALAAALGWQFVFARSRLIGLALLLVMAGEQLHYHQLAVPNKINKSELRLVRRLAKSKGAVLFLPALDITGKSPEAVAHGQGKEARRAYLATLFRRPIVNGYSGFVINEYVDFVSSLNPQIPAEFINALRERQVKTLVVVRKDTPPALAAICKHPDTKLIYSTKFFVACNVRRLARQ